MDLSSFFDSSITAVVLGWFMFRMENIIKKHTEALHKLKDAISKVKN